MIDRIKEWADSKCVSVATTMTFILREFMLQHYSYLKVQVKVSVHVASNGQIATFSASDFIQDVKHV